MKILAIDTSSATCSVAITENFKKIIELHSNDEKTHSVKLMPMIDEALIRSNLTLNDINLLSCSVGPGSFTGVRIGIATVKAFSDAKNIPVIGISSLEGLAYNLISEQLQDDSLNTFEYNLNNTLICSMIDAKNHNAYCGLFSIENKKFKQVSDLIAEDLDTIINKINNILQNNNYSKIILVGDASNIYKEVLENNIVCENIEFANNEKNISNSISIAISGLYHYMNNQHGNSNTLHPIYLRKSQAERALEEKNNS